MLTASETKEKFKAEPNNWKAWLIDFVDDFRRHRDSSAIEQPFSLDNERFDAILASTIETLCDESKMPIPEWLHEVPSCKNPYFVAEVDDLMATAIVESPVRFRLRKVFVMENFLFRV
jgi:hypothetical protein